MPIVIILLAMLQKSDMLTVKGYKHSHYDFQWFSQLCMFGGYLTKQMLIYSLTFAYSSKPLGKDIGTKYKAQN